MEKISLEKLSVFWISFKKTAEKFLKTVLLYLENSKRFSLVALIVSFVVVAFAHSPFLTLSHAADHWVFLLSGKIQSEGGQIYVDFFDHKGPVLHWLNEAAYMLTHNFWGIWGVEFFILFVAVLLCFFGLCKRIKPIFALFICLMLICINDTPLYPESFAYDLTVLGMGLLLLRPKNMIVLFVMGILGACIVFIKQTCIGFYAAAGLYLLLEIRNPEYRKYLFSYIAGGLLCVGTVLGVLAYQHALVPYYNCCILFNIWYTSYAPLPFIVNLGWLIQMKFVYFLLMLFATGILLVRKSERFSWKFMLCILFYTAFEFVCVAKAGRLWDYQFVGLDLSLLIPILYCLYCLYPETEAKQIQGMFYFSLFSVFAFLCGYYYSTLIPGKYTINLYKMVKGNTIKTEDERIADYINTLPQCKIQVWGSAYDIYVYTNRKSVWEPYYYHLPLFYMRPDQKQLEKMKDTLIKSYPSVIIDGTGGTKAECLSPDASGNIQSPSPLLQTLREFIRERYVLAPVNGYAKVYIPKEWAEDNTQK